MSPKLESLPLPIRRLFPHHDLSLVVAPESRSFLIAKLLEEGDREDLRWLIDRVGEEKLKVWLEKKGGRALSRRSRLFWQWVLAGEAGAKAEVREALWPL